MEIKKEHIKPNLLKLLEENNCVEAFLENANNAEERCDTTNFISENDTQFGQIGAAFVWKHTPEDHFFWSNINKQLPND